MSTDTNQPTDRTGQLKGLARLNLGIGLAHLVQAGAIIALTNDLALPLSATFLKNDPVAVARSGEVPVELVTTFPVGIAVAIFVGLAAIDHLLMAGPLRSRYEAQLARGVNYFRWTEYSISASLMIVLVALFAGVWDIAALAAIFGVNATMIWFGVLQEKYERPGDADSTSLLPFWFGTAAGMIPWAIIVYYFIGNGGGTPTFVYAIFVSLFIFFMSFGLNQWLQYRQVGKWRDYYFGERAYIWLSLVAKSALAWQIFGNVLRS